MKIDKIKEQQNEEVIEVLKENKLFQQLSKEIVYFIQNNIHENNKCIDFVLYELNLRCVDKNVLTRLAEQRDIKGDEE